MGGVFYEDGFFVLEDAGGKVRREGVDDGERMGSRCDQIIFLLK